MFQINYFQITSNWTYMLKFFLFFWYISLDTGTALTHHYVFKSEKILISYLSNFVIYIHLYKSSDDESVEVWSVRILFC